MSAAQQARLEEEKVLVQEFVRGPFALHGRSVIMFSCRPRGLWQVFQLQVPVRPLARFAERPAVAQLAGILDEYERYAVVLIDKDEARLLSVYLGQAEQRAHITDKYPGRNRRGGWAQARYSHHRDVHLHVHVLRAAEAVLEELRRRPFDRLMVGGPDEARSAFLHVLPRSLRGRVAGSFLAEQFLSDEEVVERVRAVEAEALREAGARLVTDVINGASAGGRAVLGWEQTLQALLEGSVHKLVLAEGPARRGSVCPTGHVAVLEALSACPFCGGPLELVNDLAEWAVEQALETDARVETVRGEGAQSLTARGDGIGAVLRY
jgi:peptide chain release factor subunit 1